WEGGLSSGLLITETANRATISKPTHGAIDHTKRTDFRNHRRGRGGWLADSGESLGSGIAVVWE
ncbi:MAG: hypothetical protein CMJ70_02280, partial [Planctomycetaceae bacterium]|nr:hypothetical protein [Planctomycetaceae bacterium]